MTANLIDGSNIFVICWSVFIRDREIVTDADSIEFYKIFFMKLKQFLNSENNIICFEGKNSKGWRLNIYPDYKAQRESMKDKPNGEYFYKYLEDIKAMLTYLPCKVIMVENCEGDDCIYTLATQISHLPDIDDITIVSGDADLTQIANFYPNIRIYHPIKKEYVSPDPNIILYKMLVGDTTDNIKYKKGLGPSTFKKLLENKQVWDTWINTEEDYTRLNQIRQIVDLRCCPVEYKNNIITYFNNTVWNEPDLENFGKYIDNDDYLLSFMNRTCNDYLLKVRRNGHISNLMLLRCNNISNDIYPDYIKGELK